jgi:AraC-like DNA-binding protein
VTEVMTSRSQPGDNGPSNFLSAVCDPGVTLHDLRDGASLIRIQPDGRTSPSLPVEADGSYLLASLCGETSVWSGPECKVLKQDRLHILRQRNGATARRIEFSAPAPLAIVIYFSTRWRQTCPQGPTCKIGRFLNFGGSEPQSVSDQALRLDDDGTAIARSMMALKDDDASVLSAEMLAMSLLSWAYVKSEYAPIARTAPASLHPRSAMKARQAADILRSRIDNPPTIAELSGLVGMNESDLKRCFKCLYGMTIASYSREKRLEAARDLLTYSSLSIARIALDIGFSNPSQFARAFRQHFGCNPSAIRGSHH